MRYFHAIAAMSENRVIGDRGRIPWHLADDYRWFKHKTMGGTLVMGRRTYESIGRPLPGRRTIVLSRNSEAIPGVTVCPSLEAFFEQEVKQPPIWICGGADIYNQLLGQCSLLYLTRIKKEVEGDTSFPSFETQFFLEQLIHEEAAFRVERWTRNGMPHDEGPDRWPLA